MTDMHWRFAAAVLIGLVGTVRCVYDYRRMTGDMRRDWWPQVIIQLLGIAIAIQLMGFEVLPMKFSAEADLLVRVTGAILSVPAAIGAVWPRVARPTWSGPGEWPDRKQGHRLVTRGPYTYIRHPFYAACILGLASVELMLASYLFCALLPVVLMGAVVVLKLEESQLETVYGDAYLVYKASTWRLVPLIY